MTRMVDDDMVLPTMSFMVSYEEADYGMGGCCTPTRIESRIPAASVPPPPPKKKKKPCRFGKKQQGRPQNGYFNPPDLDEVFRPFIVPDQSSQACV